MIAQEHREFEADLLHTQLTGETFIVGEGEDAEEFVCTPGNCEGSDGLLEGWDKPGSGWVHPKIKKGASPCRFAGQDNTLKDRMAAWAMPKF